VHPVSDFVVISGMSGAGRTQVGNALEDLGWFVIDNLPPVLIPKVAELAFGPRSTEPKVALALGPSTDHAEVEIAVQQLRASGATVRVLFLDASTEVLVRRYESTKRRHPQEGEGGLVEAVERERTVLAPIRESADLVIDTSELNVHELRNRIVERFADQDPDQLMQTTIMTFGYKYGLPGDVDLVIDCRFLENPYWDVTLRELTGLDQPIQDFVHARPEAGEFLDRLESLLELLIPAYRNEGKAYLTIALGCTGGRHRSVALAEALRDRLRKMSVEPRVHHRDVAK